MSVNAINVVLALMIIGSFLVAIIIHESGHSLMATMLGDPTPRTEGRLRFSLPAHIDPLGTLLPSRQAVGFARSATYGPFIILVILFLLPFLGQISGFGGLFIFHIPFYILLGSLDLIGLVSGLPVAGIYTSLYTF